MLASLILSKRQGMFLCMKRIVIVLAALIASIAPAYADFGAGFAAYSRGEYEEAVEQWRSVADEGNVKAQVGLGFMYEKGLGVPQDFTKAVRWYRQAADQDDSIAQYNLGVMYGNGTGVLQDYVEAHRLFSLAATQGNEDARNSLSYIEKLMTAPQLALSKNNNADEVAKNNNAGEVAKNNNAGEVAENNSAGEVAENNSAGEVAKVNSAGEVAKSNNADEVAVVPASGPAQAPKDASPAPQIAAAADPAPVVQAAKARTVTPLVNTAKAPRPEAPARTPIIDPVKVSPQIAAAPKAPAVEVAPTTYEAPAVATPVLAVAEKPATPTTQDTGSVQIAAKTPAPKVIPASAAGPWRVHLVSLQNGGAIDDEWLRLRKLHPGALETLSMSVQEIDIPQKGHFFRLLAGSFESEASAKSACAALEAEDQYCRPMRR
ncbi:MAG: SPOR domain-containing protein [Alphaproteobacteria bacterium]